MRRWLIYVVAGVPLALVLIAAAAILMLGRFDLSGPAAARLSAALGRPVTIAALHITPGRWLGVAARDIHVANLPGGTQAEMAAVADITAEIDALSLLHPPLQFRRLEVHGLSLLMEHVADGQPNWRSSKAPAGADAPQDRSGYPTLLDAHVSGSEVTFHTSHGHNLVTRLDDATIKTTGPDAPIRLEAAGAFHDVPVRLQADLQSTAKLRHSAAPFGTDVQLSSGGTTLRFEGTMTRPLQVDGADGKLTLNAPTLEPLLAIAGTKLDLATSLTLGGHLTRTDKLWVLAEAAGAVGDNAFAGSTIRLTEGAYGRPALVDLDLSFDQLKPEPLLAHQGGHGESDAAFTVNPDPDPQLNAKLMARRLSYGTIEATDVEGAGTISPGQIKLERLALKALGARLQAMAQVDAVEKTNRLSAEVSLTDLNMTELGRYLRASRLPVQGSLNAEAATEATGSDLAAAIRAARVSAVVWMGAGRISRDLIEMASADLRRLFGAPKGTTEVRCVLGIADLRDGVGTVSDLRIRTDDGTIAGHGSFDLNREFLDMTLGAQSATTSDFALDVPFHVSGPFRKLSVEPAVGSTPAAGADLNRLPPALSQAARRSRCL